MKKQTLNPITKSDLNIPNEAWGLFLISILGLFLETLFIRWVGTEIRIFAYLQNTILVVCFLGIGLGAFTSARPIQIRQSLFPLIIFLALMAIPAIRTFLGLTSEMLSVLDDFVIWSDLRVNDAMTQIAYVIFGLVLTYFLLILVVDIFVPIGRILGRLLNANPNPIWAYSINIFGSILGTWAFVLLSFFYQPPFVWFLIAGLLLAVFVIWLKQQKVLNLSLLGIIIILSWFASRTSGALDVIWSPYQKLVVREASTDELGEYIINVNNVGYQEIVDLSDTTVNSNPNRFPPELRGFSQYDLPYLLHPNPKSVLIVGAGSGNDAAGALRNHVQSIAAVEIDPAIISIGQNLHPEHPYSSPNVQLVNDDARSFFATTTETYDIISFGLLDSHTTTALTNARLDHYVYTLESIVQAKSKLNEGGVMVLNFYAQRLFIADRIKLTLEEAFGYPPKIIFLPQNSYGRGGIMYITGDLEAVQAQIRENERLLNYVKHLEEQYPFQASLPNTTKIATDDWPYLYLESPKIPSLYYLLVGLMAIIFIRSYRKWQASTEISFSSLTFWHFFFLGAAFLLLEVQNISKASVVLGNTWEVNAVIISSILGMALLANWVAYKFPKLPLTVVYGMLILVNIGLYFVDLATFGLLPYFTKALIVGSLTSLPMLFSGIIFTRSFAIARERSNALGANLIGALVGALLQSLTFIIGIKALLLIVACFYLISLLTSPALHGQEMTSTRYSAE